MDARRARAVWRRASSADRERRRTWARRGLRPRRGPGPQLLVALGVCGLDAAARALSAAVDRDREVEQDLVGARQLGFQPVEQVGGARRGGEEALLHLGERVQLDELLLERAREAAAAEVPAVELLQEPGRAALAELADGL